MLVEYLDGQYERLASCLYQQLARRDGQVLLTDLREQRTVRVTLIKPPDIRWELSFIDEDGGRQTRLQATSANGTFPTEHTLALARACAA